MADGEKGDKNVEISDSDRKMDALADMIRDACSKLDEGSKRQDARMDAMEDNFKRMDSERRDASRKDEDDDKDEKKADRKDSDDEDKKADRKDSDDEDKDEKKADRKDSDKEEFGEPKKAAADKGRKDSDDEDKDDKKADRKDAAKKDEDDDSMADADRPMTRAEAAALRAEIAGMNRNRTTILADADRERFAAIQEHADPAFQAFGDRAPSPLDGETPVQYKRRLTAKLLPNSTKWEKTRLSAISDESTLDVIMADVFADSVSAARRGANIPAGQLRERVRQQGGHTIIEFDGGPETWMDGFAGHSMRGTGNFRLPN